MYVRNRLEQYEHLSALALQREKEEICDSSCFKPSNLYCVFETHESVTSAELCPMLLYFSMKNGHI